MDIENKLAITKGESEWARDKLEVWDKQTYTPIYKINNKVLLDSTGNYIQYLIITYNGREPPQKYLNVWIRYYIQI